MRSKFNNALGIVLLLPLFSFTEAKAAPHEPVFTSAAEIKDLPPIGDKLATVRKIEGGSHMILSARRVGAGEVENHMTQDTFYVVREGHGNVVLGTKVDGDHERAPNERAGGTIVGGHTYSMSAGDILWIPAGVAHQVIVPKGESFSFVVFRYWDDSAKEGK
jgi:mannose-6-phosphate isomerase-like protein (cupin superfamily)